MSDIIDINLTEIIEPVNINSTEIIEIIDINSYEITETVDLTIYPTYIEININKVSGAGLVTSVNGQIGDVIINEADPQVNSDWNATSGVAMILNKPTIPNVSGLASITYVDNQDALKVDKIAGKGLSTNDYTTTEQTKLAGIQAGAEVNVNADWNATSGDAMILNKPVIGAGDMLKSVYDTDNSGVVDNAEAIIIIGRNSTGSVLRRGTIIYIYLSTGNRPNFVKAQASGESTSAGTFGVIVNDINNNADGNCCVLGYLDNLDTRTTATHPFTNDVLVDGDTIYLSPTTAGYITNIKPSAPNHLVYLGKVTRTSPTNGTIIYRIQNGYELEELHNVSANSPNNNEALLFESSTSLWKPKQIISNEINLGVTAIAPSQDVVFKNIENLGLTQTFANAYTFRASTIGSGGFVTTGQPTAGIVTFGNTTAFVGGTTFKRQVRINFSTTAVAGSISFFRTTYSIMSLGCAFDCDWLFGTADIATVSGARSFIGFSNSFGTPANVEPTSLINIIGIARLSTSNNWHIVHNDATGLATSIDLGASFPSDTLEIDLIYFKLKFNLDNTVSYLVVNVTTSEIARGLISSNLPTVGLFETIWTTNNTNTLIASLGFCFRTFTNKKL
jgi:hypothetical protein